MEMTEKERLMLVEKKELICRLTLKNIDMAHDPQNALEIKKNFTTILLELNTVASYSDSKNYDLNQFTEAANALFRLMSLEGRRWTLVPLGIENVCNFANSVRFDFTKKRFKIALPKNLNLGFITNK
jgi:hypothetical protein